MSGRCETCRFWKMDESTNDPNDPEWGFGSCRRTPPVVVDCLVAAEIVPPQYGQQTDLEMRIENIYNGSRFPSTFATDWCGEYRPVQMGGEKC